MRYFELEVNETMLQFIANGLCFGSIIAVVALGFGLIYNTTRVFHIAHAGIYLLSGYVVWVSFTLCKLPLAPSILLSLAVAAIAGVLIDWAVYQPLDRLSASTAVLMISSLGVLIVFENAVALVFGSQRQILQYGIDRTITFGSVVLTHVQIAQLIVSSLLTGALWLFLKHTQAGQICRAVSDDETLALVLGTRVTSVRLLVFALGSIFAAVGSVLTALDVGLDPHVGFPVILTAAVACIIGGLRNFLAPAAGGFILGALQSLVAWQTSLKWKEAVTFVLLILFLLLYRQGLFGVIKRVEEA
jgi:branched-chain amino acid transport system permease protein